MVVLEVVVEVVLEMLVPGARWEPIATAAAVMEQQEGAVLRLPETRKFFSCRKSLVSAVE
ncbi:hypothetical protein E2C01_056222 [Portunus trituberculatus]|uniref:Uncharacterized protein n=1 Tax=Portunus trituberculatus TaxID=210409 RepID=A0A5B7GX79_PORTR|nr:hypothetical protein [Portunus trituberculatus]